MLLSTIYVFASYASTSDQSFAVDHILASGICGRADRFFLGSQMLLSMNAAKSKATTESTIMGAPL
jgi:hypothetical protein